MLSGISSALLLGLLYVYLSNHRQVRSPFTLGLIFFASLLLVENVGFGYFYYLMSEWGEGPAMALPMLGLNVVELVGFAALFYVTWR